MKVDFKQDFMDYLQQVNRPYFLKKMTSQAGVIAVNFSKERFKQKNWVDKSREPWKPRTRKKRRGSTLVRSGRLKRSIRKLTQGNYYVIIGTDVPYAQIHNEGGVINKKVEVRAHSRKRKNTRGNAKKDTKAIQVKAHTRNVNMKIAKRQFMGESALLTRRIERHMLTDIKRQLKL